MKGGEWCRVKKEIVYSAYPYLLIASFSYNRNLIDGLEASSYDAKVTTEFHSPSKGDAKTQTILTNHNFF